MTVDKICDVCKSDFVFLTTREVYTTNLSDWNVIYYCGNCGASVGTRKDSDEPLGYMATPLTRYLRGKAHEAFDPIWRSNLLSRGAAIRWASSKLLIVEEFHISRLTNTQLRELIKISEEYLQKRLVGSIDHLIAKNTERRQRNAKRLSKHNSIHAEQRRAKRMH